MGAERKKMQKMKYWYWFASIPFQFNQTKQKLWHIFKSPEKIWNLHKEDLERISIEQTEIQKILNFQYRQNLENQIYAMQKKQIQLITYEDQRYPYLLKQIYDPPLVLFAKGNLALLKKDAVAMVGCRMCSTYGKKIAFQIAGDLTKQGYIIISGMAKGIDGYAHQGALAKKGGTIAVLGSGVDVIYPKQNEKLYDCILAQNGLILSEYIPGAKPIARHFPARNRIISGLAKGVVVVEAKARSGSLITVDFALEQGREVFAIPGNLNNPNAAGTNRLIQQGAKLVTDVDDIREELDLFFEKPLKKQKSIL